METPVVLGVDLGTATIKAFLASAQENNTIRVIASSAVPTVGFEKGALTDAPALAMAVRRAVDNALAAAGAPMMPIFLGLGGLDIRSFNSIGSITLEPGRSIAQTDIDKVHSTAVSSLLPENYSVMHVLPLAYWIDGQKQTSVPVHGAGERLETEIHVVAIAQKTLNELTNALQIVGISVDTVVANAIAGAQILRSQSLPDHCLFMDIGAGTTDMVIYHGGKVQMSATLPIGGEYITTDLMQGLQVSRPHAEGIKCYYAKLDQTLLGQKAQLDCNASGTTDKVFPYDFLYNIVESRVEEISSLLCEFTRPLLVKYNIDRIFLTGGCAVMPSIKNGVERIFGMQTELIEAQGLPEEYVHPASTACFGILHYAMQNRSMPEIASPQTRQGLFQKIRKLF